MPGYIWRRLTEKQQGEVLAWRKEHARRWHSPPHRPNFGNRQFLITAACYEHAPYIGSSPQRMDAFSASLLYVFQQHADATVAWCILPNHYHALIESTHILQVLHELGQFHGRTSYAWNREENARGRHVFHRAAERFMRSERHFMATLNYVHHNPVRHGYVATWTEWPWSSAAEYLEQTGRVETERIWKEYPIRDYGAKWDEPAL
jgi:putative transposase